MIILEGYMLFGCLNECCCTGSSLDPEHICVLFECSVCVVREDALCKDFAELYAFLVEAVQIPEESLEHDLVFEVREECAERFRCQLVACDDAGRSAAVELLVQVVVFFSAGEGYDLSCYVSAKLFLACAALDLYVSSGLVFSEADELERNDVLALMEELVE